MAEKTGIEWTDATWNPWYGCKRVSPGCANCYADRDMTRFGKDFKTVTRAADHTFYAPLRWKEPQRIFTCSWSDFFIAQADEWREEAWSIIKRTPQHQYQILTKRPGRMLPWVNGWPVNAWAGTSVEEQKYAPRLDVLAQVPAAIRFVSVEPLLGPVDLRSWLKPSAMMVHGDLSSPDTAAAIAAVGGAAFRQEWGLSWVIVGGESGPQARPMHPQWVRDIRDQCLRASVPFFFKQWGEWLPEEQCVEGQFRAARERYGEEDEYGLQRWAFVGKKATGALLDGREWREMPETTSPWAGRTTTKSDGNPPGGSSMRCRVCGCSEFNACWDEVLDQPCHWVEVDLCSVCARLAVRTIGT